MREALYDTNIVFVFDKRQLNRMQAMGIPHVFYRPLAANMTRVGTLSISDADIAKYRSDSSFVGNLYHNKKRDVFFSALPEDIRSRTRKLVDERVGHWDENHSRYPELDDAMLDILYRQISAESRELYSFERQYLST